MGIADLRTELADVPGAAGLTMRYEEGGAVQVFMLPDVEVRVLAMATTPEIRAAILAERDRLTKPADPVPENPATGQ